MRTLAIGDIHGCYRSLDTLASFVGLEKDDRIVTLGDYVDRGPDSRRVLQWLIDRVDSGQLIPLRGNHEVMMVEALQSERHLEEWLACGGDAVLSSYEAERLTDIPTEHWHFLTRSLRSHFITETHFFVHANACAEIPIDQQPDEILYWESFRDPPPHESGLTMVCGHTAQRGGIPLSIGHAICIDTWACGEGWLTCLDVQTGNCWQANESGSTRHIWLDERR
ncbi:metallophosphoesterase family protein [Rhodopirellula sp. MGV]|uniref:metallophosphoesterase family protein n=1 Tax=Rhodopirellula sp. MGV TaxID=2023130 RepID=UPI000B9681D9|nr:metallophosphoesterase family protein [Rhodopirellula sp. MGV]OYP35143.1 serine/threonine protein phosphatase [Rhodopirellula sp. MGV]PNY36783.1 serine/threonine protein phosphatase [Rhodopirellula baltica]